MYACMQVYVLYMQIDSDTGKYQTTQYIFPGAP